ncbi:MAG: hypothetical protein E6Q97_30525 [Desulfurellales bacterium]|nr:MAG: hypothetical protein E6Q97_30525 [Desulfurellales bacterium]
MAKASRVQSRMQQQIDEINRKIDLLLEQTAPKSVTITGMTVTPNSFEGTKIAEGESPELFVPHDGAQGGFIPNADLPKLVPEAPKQPEPLLAPDPVAPGGDVQAPPRDGDGSPNTPADKIADEKFDAAEAGSLRNRKNK